MKILWRRLACFSVIAFVLGSCGEKEGISPSVAMEEWNEANHPSKISSAYTRRLAQLPFKGEATRRPWTDSYWPANRGGVASRWQSASRDGFSYPVNDFMTVLAMRPEQVAKLSPAEKYDIFRGDMTYSLVSAERRDNHPFEAGWAGYCHGWAAAAINMDEPKAVTLVSPQGVVIPFGAADVKALVSYAQAASGTEETTRILGERCDVPANSITERYRRSECRDTNAGSFHVILANMIGLRGKPIIIDSSPSEEIWNHPVFAYSTMILKQIPLYARAAPETEKILSVRTTISYVGNTAATWSAGQYSTQSVSEQTYDYTLELNRKGEIVGGEWLQDTRPDFIWVQDPPKWSSLTKDIEFIYRASIGR